MNALTIVHGTIKQYVKEGALCIDATAGRGYDTAFLAELVGKSGRVIAFDIQQEAVDSTKKLLEEKGLSADVILDSHSNMDKYADENTVDCIVFNLGYLPRGNHAIFTHFDSTRQAIEKGLKLLKAGGLMCVSVYYGGDSGYEEKDALLPWLKTLDDSKYQVLATFFYNWKKDPPIPIFIIKNV
ncbi:MAG: class I SAM-dependent methyltransferase [Clostridia bacterium]|nr:class I SAM-dependent methyltransferase [Clostridia bacterium]